MTEATTEEAIQDKETNKIGTTKETETLVKNAGNKNFKLIFFAGEKSR
jgi:hypothetical protein